MSIVSHLHQLFNAEMCQSYIHALRWKDRPLQCPRCQSHNVGPWGTYHYQPGLKRYRPSLKTIVHAVWNRIESQSVTQGAVDACI